MLKVTIALEVSVGQLMVFLRTVLIFAVLLGAS